MRITATVLISFFTLSLFGQDDVVKLTNPSFEDVPHQGKYRTPIKGWFDCGLKNFPNESAPDIHPSPNQSYWGNFKETYEDETYLGMVARDNSSWESVSQKLSSHVLADQCYDFSVVLARNDIYLSGSRYKKEHENDDSPVPYTTPIVLRLWGGDTYCDTNELLAESPPIDHNDWKEYMFTFKPKSTFNFITIEAFYEVPVFELYNGHILVDACSDIVKTSCPENVDIYAVDYKNVDLIVEHSIASIDKPQKPQRKNTTKPQQKTDPIPTPIESISSDPIVQKEKILTDLDPEKIKKGQIIEIKNLFFAADTSSIHGTSTDVLDEVYQFLKNNENVVIEIGGHTNSIPPEAYCDRLSKERATSVASYLKSRGIPTERILIKGYGKRNPIASNKTMIGRKKNQRVEIKILEV